LAISSARGARGGARPGDSALFVLWALFDPTPSLHTFDFIVFGHLLIGGLSIGALGWRAGWPIAACVLAAAVFMFGGAAAVGRPYATWADMIRILEPLT
jgi:hypothetical protein